MDAGGTPILAPDEALKSYGEVRSLQLAERYGERDTPRVGIHLGDIAHAVLHFASVGWSGKSTGSVLNVDGGAPTGYAR